MSLFGKKKQKQQEAPVLTEPKEEINLNEINTASLVSKFKNASEADFEVQRREMIKKVQEAEKELKKQAPLFIELQEAYNELARMIDSQKITEEVNEKVMAFVKGTATCASRTTLRVRYGSVGSKKYGYFDEFCICSPTEVKCAGWIDLYPDMRIRRSRGEERASNTIDVSYSLGDLYTEKNLVLKSGPLYIEMMRKMIDVELPRLKKELALFMKQI